jgi:hypothetical protein
MIVGGDAIIGQYVLLSPNAAMNSPSLDSMLITMNQGTARTRHRGVIHSVPHLSEILPVIGPAGVRVSVRAMMKRRVLTE